MITISLNKPIAEITGKEGIIDKRIGVFIEPCLVTYNVKISIGNEARGKYLNGYQLEGKNEKYIATAVKNCIQFILHRIPKIEEEKIYEVTRKDIKGDKSEKEELFEEI